MRVAMIAAECEPWAKTGGLGDVVDALARSLGRVPDGPDAPVDVFLPRYRSVPVPADAGAAIEVSVPDPLAGGRPTTIRIVDVAADGYRLRLVDHPPAFDRDSFYDQPDDAWRFGMFCRAALEAVRADAAGGRPAVDVLHIHDWHTGPVALYRDRWYTDDPVIGRAAVVDTLHNLAYHGWTPLAAIPSLGLRPGDAVIPRETDGVDLLRVGIERSELANTVSPTYATEARTPEFGFGLETVLRAKGDRFDGILNGLDPDVWDPLTDPALTAPYGPADPSGKAACRRDLLTRLGMDASDDHAILGAVGRLDPQKGFDLVVDAAPSVLARGARLVIQANGDPLIAAAVRALETAHPGRVAFIDRFDREMARRIYAGADALLVPSRFEPSGLVQMIGMRYGTPPIAHAVGGLVDSIVDELARPGQGTGFLFRGPSGARLAEAIGWALDLRGDGTTVGWRGLVARGMATDFAWETTAAPAYVAHYRRAIELRRGAIDRPG